MNKINSSVVSEAISRLMPRIIRGMQLDFFAKRAITQSQFFVIVAVHSYGRCSMTELSRNMKVQMPTATGLADRLVQNGYVKRFQDPQDRRKVLLELTPQGQRFIEEFRSVMRRRWEEVLGHLGASDLKKFYEVISKLIQSTALAFVVALGMSGQTFASEAPLTLHKAFQIAKEKNPAVLMAQQRTRQAFERLLQAKSYALPHAQADVSWQRLTKNLETLGIPVSSSSAAGSVSPLIGPLNVFDARIKVVQNLFDLAMIKRLDAAGIGRDLSAAELEKTKDDTLLLVAAMYIDAVRARQESEAVWQGLKVSRKAYTLARLQFKIGSQSALEIRNAEAVLWENRTLWRASRSKAASRLSDLQETLNLPEDQQMSLSDDFLGDIPAGSGPKAPRADFSSQSDIRLLEKKLEFQKAEEAVEGAGYFPRVALAGDYGPNGNTMENTENTYTYGVQLTWPFFESGNRQARIAESQSKVRETTIGLEDAKRQKTSKIQEAQRLQADLASMKDAKEKFHRWSQDQRRLTEIRFKNGSASFYDLLAAQWQESSAQNQRQEAEAAYSESKIHLTYLLGEIQK